VVFTGIAIARLVRDEFRKMGRVPGPYSNVGVSFSHDPCERPMNLITQMPPTASSGSGNPNFTRLGGNPPKRKSSLATPNLNVDADGWQTVSKRR